MDTLYTFWDNITHYKTESVHFLGLMNSATKTLKEILRQSPWLTECRMGNEGAYTCAR